MVCMSIDILYVNRDTVCRSVVVSTVIWSQIKLFFFFSCKRLPAILIHQKPYGLSWEDKGRLPQILYKCTYMKHQNCLNLWTFLSSDRSTVYWSYQLHAVHHVIEPLIDIEIFINYEEIAFSFEVPKYEIRNRSALIMHFLSNKSLFGRQL